MGQRFAQPGGSAPFEHERVRSRHSVQSLSLMRDRRDVFGRRSRRDKFDSINK
jgi:hypothetical protein